MIEIIMSSAPIPNFWTYRKRSRTKTIIVAIPGKSVHSTTARRPLGLSKFPWYGGNVTVADMVCGGDLTAECSERGDRPQRNCRVSPEDWRGGRRTA